jgi:hypothetical protein
MGRSGAETPADSSSAREPGSAKGAPRFRLTRVHIAALAIVVVGLWVVLSFGRTITALNSATDREQQLSDETAQLTEQLDASHRELEIVQTDGFQALQARAFGIGEPGEINFSLEPGAPSPAPVVPLGSERNEAAPHTPLDAWLRLLFDN